MALLVKGCKPHHNIKVSKTLQMGTLSYYQEHENEEIKDADEGTYNFIIRFEGKVTLNKVWAATLLQNIMHFDSVVIPKANGYTKRGFSKNINFSIGADTVTFWDSDFQIERTSYDSFVYCMTLAESEAEAEGIFKSYDDRWVVNVQNTDELAKRLAWALGRAIAKGRESGNHVISPDAPLDRISMKCSFRSVDYLNRTLNVTDESTIKVWDFINLTNEMAFIKDPRDKSQKEYRFNFWIISDLNPDTGMCVEWPPVCKTVVLEADHILELLE